MLHVFIGLVDIPRPEGHAHIGAVEQARPAGRNDGPEGGLAHERSVVEVFEGVGENLGVGVAVFVGEGGHRLRPGRVGEALAKRIVPAELLVVLAEVVRGAAGHGVGVPAHVEHRHEVVGRPAAAVVAHVDDEPLFVVAAGV